MKRFYDITPFVMLVITAVSGIYRESGLYKELFTCLSDVLGYSIFTNLVMLRVYKSPKFCHATRIAVYGLITMNIVSIMGNWLNFYTRLFDLFITFIVFVVIIHLMLKKKNVITSRHSR